jgi:hypothetical protein
LAGACALIATSATAGQVILYEGLGLYGRSMTTTDAIPVIESSSFNGVASSIVVRDGTWEVCTEPYFRGTCARLGPGNYSRLSDDLRGFVASVRQIGYSTPVARVAPITTYTVTAPIVVSPDSTPVIVNSAPVVVERQVIVPGEVIPAGARVTLYQHTGGGWRAIELTQSTSDLGTRNFANSADAAFVGSGIWRLCDREHGRGQCVDLRPGQYTSLGTLDRRVRSAYLVSTTPEAVATVRPIPNGRAIAYEYPNFAGHSAVIAEGRAPDLDWANFRMPANSLRIESGTWMVCSELGYQGECRVLGPGEYPTIPGLVGVASARQIWQPDYVASTSGWTHRDQLLSRNFVATP